MGSPSVDATDRDCGCGLPLGKPGQCCKGSARGAERKSKPRLGRREDASQGSPSGRPWDAAGWSGRVCTLEGYTVSKMVYVTSANRGAAKRLLVSFGHPAVEVRGWPLAKLGATLREAFEAGDDARKAHINACLSAAEGTSEDEAVEADKAETPKAEKAQPSPLAAAIIRELEAAGYKPTGIDAETVRETVAAAVAEAVEAARLRPSVIEVRGPGEVRKIDGRQHPVFGEVVAALAANLHVMMVGPAGSGKSTVAVNAAEALGRPCYMTGAVMSKYDLIGFVSPTGDERTLRTPFREAFENGGIFILDDTDRSDAKALAAFNGALANGRYSFPDREVSAHPDFVCVATANTWGNGATAEYVGAGRIDSATLDRFYKVHVGYDEELEREFAGPEHKGWVDYVQRVRRAVEKLGIKHLVTPRATIKGAKALAAGIDRSKVEKATLFAGLDADTEARIRAAA